MSEQPIADLVETYLQLGGTRKSANDDNATSTRKWEAEPSQAKAYWDEKIATLSGDQLQEAETHLPSISSST